MGFIININKGNIIPIKEYYVGGMVMDYKKAYALLVGTISNAIDEIGKSHIISQEMENAMQMLMDGLENTEEMYLSAEEQN
jgi:hypothetical protein